MLTAVQNNQDSLPLLRRIVLLGCVALVAQRLIVVKLSRGHVSVCTYVSACVRASVGLSSALWKNGGSDPDAVWYHKLDGSRNETGSSGVWESVHGKGYFSVMGKS